MEEERGRGGGGLISRSPADGSLSWQSGSIEILKRQPPSSPLECLRNIRRLKAKNKAVQKIDFQRKIFDTSREILIQKELQHIEEDKNSYIFYVLGSALERFRHWLGPFM